MSGGGGCLQVMSVRAESQSERVQASFGPKKDPLLLQHTPFIVDVARVRTAAQPCALWGCDVLSP